MKEIVPFILNYGYWLLVALVFVEQVGLPIPALPALLAMGALCGLGYFTFAFALAWSVVASVLADWLWFQLGVRRGHAVLSLLCRVSLEPDSCVRRTEDLFGRSGAGALLFAKFVPGLSTAAPPMAGTFRMDWRKFLLADAAGAAIWAGSFLLVGYLFRTELERAADYALGLGSWLGAVLAAVLAGYIGWKYIQRRRFFHKLATARIAPEELMRELEAGVPVVIVDLRHALDIEAEGFKLPGAIHMLPEEVEARQAEIPRDRDVVLYCT